MKSFLAVVFGLTLTSLGQANSLEPRVESLEKRVTALEQNWNAVENSLAYPKNSYLVAAGAPLLNNSADCEEIVKGGTFPVLPLNRFATVLAEHQCKNENYLLVKFQGDPLDASLVVTVSENFVQKLK